jgi:hypothetical protein
MMLPIKALQMTNTEQDYNATIKKEDTPKENPNPTKLRRRFNIEMPGEPDGKPPVTLPITGTTNNLEELNETDNTADGEAIDSGNNYTAAENDHNTNATL